MTTVSGRQKAAAILLCVDPQTAASVLKHLPEEELAAITREMHALSSLEPDVTASLLQEFAIRAAGDSQGVAVTPGVLRERLNLALGQEAARRLLKNIGIENDVETAFKPLAELSPDDLNKVLMDEHPQTAALVLSQLSPKQAAGVLALFPPERQMDVVRRMSATQQADEAILKRVGQIIHSKARTASQRLKTPEDSRFKRVAEVINLLGPEAEERILKQLADEAPDMVERIKAMMFVFEDLRTLSDADMRKVLMNVDTQVLAMALKTASEGLKEKIFSNLSRRAAETVREELELLGRKPLSQVKAAQQQIVETVRGLESAGEINLRGAKYEEDPLV